MVVFEIALQNPYQVFLVENNDVIQTVTPYAADEPLYEWILPRRPPGRDYALHAQVSNTIAKRRSVDAVAIANHVPGRAVPWERIDHLLGSPCCGGVGCNVEVQHTSTVVRQNQHYEKHAERSCGDDKEVD